MSIKDHDQQARKQLKASQENNKKMTHIFIIHSQTYCETTQKVMVVKSSYEYCDLLPRDNNALIC